MGLKTGTMVAVTEVRKQDSNVGDSERCIFAIGSEVCMVVQCKMRELLYSNASTTHNTYTQLTSIS